MRLALEGAFETGVQTTASATAAASRGRLPWMDRSGGARGTVGEPDGNNLNMPSVSADGRRTAVHRTLQGNADIWLLDGERTTRLTFGAALDLFPIWSPDGARIVFRSNRTGIGDLYEKLTSGAGAEERLVASDQGMTPSRWSSDGRFLLYHSIEAAAIGSGDIWVVPMMGDRTPSVFLKATFNERWGTFSPDGRWVAYYSNESGRNEIYVRPFVPPGAAGPAAGVTGQWQVSAAGGIHPVWRADGKELYFLNPAGAMMAAPIAVDPYTQPVKDGQPYNLYHGTFEARPVTATTSTLIYAFVYDNSMLPDEGAREADKARRTASFTERLQNMKKYLEGGGAGQ